jgi:hypothetical protein
MACALTNSAPIEASDIIRDVHTKFGKATLQPVPNRVALC